MKKVNMNIPKSRKFLKCENTLFHCVTAPMMIHCSEDNANLRTMCLSLVLR